VTVFFYFIQRPLTLIHAHDPSSIQIPNVLMRFFTRHIRSEILRFTCFTLLFCFTIFFEFYRSSSHFSLVFLRIVFTHFKCIWMTSFRAQQLEVFTNPFIYSASHLRLHAPELSFWCPLYTVKKCRIGSMVIYSQREHENYAIYRLNISRLGFWFTTKR